MKPPGQRTRAAAKADLHAARKLQCIEMRRSGWTFDQIAARIGISQVHASRLYKAAILDTYRRPAEEERELELSRVDGLLRRWWPDLLQRDDAKAERASNQIRWILHYRADLLGLKVTKLDVKISEGVTIPADADVWEALRAMRLQSGPQVIDVEALPQANGHVGNGSTP
jgi:hypothetical protein